MTSIGYETGPEGIYITEYLLTDDNEEHPSHLYIVDDNDEVVWTEEYNYDDEINLISLISYDQLGDEMNRYEYTYDDYGNVLTGYCYYNGGINFGYDYQYTYDLNGNVLNSIRLSYSSNGSREKVAESVYEYDESGNVLSYTQISYNNDQVSSQSETVYIYDGNGNVIVETYYSYGELSWQYEYIYTAISK